MRAERVVGPAFFLEPMELSPQEMTAEIQRRVAALGYELVDLRRRAMRNRVALQIRVDRPEASPGHGITVDECAAVSRALESWLDESQVLGLRYVLEVSSPGIERPVRWREHWERFTGRDVNVRLPGRGRLRARIVAVRRVNEMDEIVLRPENGTGEITVPLEDARDATLVVDWSAIDWSSADTADGRRVKEKS